MCLFGPQLSHLQGEGTTAQSVCKVPLRQPYEALKAERAMRSVRAPFLFQVVDCGDISFPVPRQWECSHRAKSYGCRTGWHCWGSHHASMSNVRCLVILLSHQGSESFQCHQIPPCGVPASRGVPARSLQLDLKQYFQHNLKLLIGL